MGPPCKVSLPALPQPGSVTNAVLSETENGWMLAFALSLAGLDAIEVYHSDHDKETVERYHRMASELGLLMTGGSDFHGDPTHGIEPGTSTLPATEWQRLNAARRRHVVE